MRGPGWMMGEKDRWGGGRFVRDEGRIRGNESGGVYLVVLEGDFVEIGSGVGASYNPSSVWSWSFEGVFR